MLELGIQYQDADPEVVREQYMREVEEIKRIEGQLAQLEAARSQPQTSTNKSRRLDVTSDAPEASLERSRHLVAETRRALGLHDLENPAWVPENAEVRWWVGETLGPIPAGKHGYDVHTVVSIAVNSAIRTERRVSELENELQGARSIIDRERAENAHRVPDFDRTSYIHRDDHNATMAIVERQATSYKDDAGRARNDADRARDDADRACDEANRHRVEHENLHQHSIDELKRRLDDMISKQKTTADQATSERENMTNAVREKRSQNEAKQWELNTDLTKAQNLSDWYHDQH